MILTYRQIHVLKTGECDITHHFFYLPAVVLRDVKSCKYKTGRSTR